jgi:hypothetical protein
MSNYLALEDKYLESKFYIPRPSEAAGGFQDPWTSRLIISKFSLLRKIWQQALLFGKVCFTSP